MKSYLCIGDIHGCLEQLNELIASVHAALAPPDSDRIGDHVQWIFLGDYIDRGPDPAGVIERLRRHGEQYPATIYLLGNHEAMLFDVIESVRPERAAAFLKAKGISRANYDWLRDNVRFSYQTGEYLFSHAGLNPNRRISEQTNDDFLWSYHLEDFLHLTSWNIVHGHITVPEVTITGNNINVDSGCGKGGLLSAILLPERRIFQSTTIGVNQARREFFRETEA